MMIALQPCAPGQHTWQLSGMIAAVDAPILVRYHCLSCAQQVKRPMTAAEITALSRVAAAQTQARAAQAELDAIAARANEAAL